VDHRIRVALAGLAPLVRDIVRDVVSRQADMKITAVIDQLDDESVDALTDPVDVCVLGIQEGRSVSCERLVERRAARRVIGISFDGRRTLLCELRPTTAHLGELSADELLDVIRGGSRMTV
jgi:hypothetical protein